MRFRWIAISALLLFSLCGFVLHGGGKISGGIGTTVETTSFYNAAATTSPGTTTPIQSGLWVNEGSIPSGMIAVPSIGGTTLTQWQVDSIASPWTGGSVRGGSFSAIIPNTLSGHTASQVTWTLASGSWPNTSSGTIGNVTSETDFKLALSGVTNSWVTNYQGGMPFGTLMAPVIAPGGGMTSIHMRQAPTYGFSCASPGFGSVTGCVLPSTTATASSTGATISVASTTGANSGNLSQVGLYDVTTSTDLGAVVSVGTGTITVDSAQTVTNGDTLQLFYAVSGCGTGANVPLFSLTTSGGLPTGGTVKSAGHCPAFGSGAWTFDINKIIAGISGTPISCDQDTTNSQVCQYAKGNVKDGYRIYGDFIDNAATAWAANTGYSSGTQVTSNGNLYTETVATCTSAASGIGPTGRAGSSGLITGIVDGSCLWNVAAQPIEGEAWIERWKNADGSTLAYQIIFAVIPVHYTAGGSTTSYTFTADLMDGATEIHGSAGGDATWQGIVSPAEPNEWLTVNSTYQPFWYQKTGGTTNDPGWNNVVVSLSTADKVYWKPSRVFAPPSDKLALSQLTLTNDISGNMAKGTCASVPYADCDLDGQATIGAGGSHAWDGPMSLANISHYISESVLSGGGGDGGRTWLQNSDAGAINELGYQAGLFEPATFHPVNVLPTATSAGWTKPASFVDPVRQSAWMWGSGGTDMNVGNGMWPSFMGTPGFDPEHNPELLSYPYIMQGYRFLLDSMVSIPNLMELTFSPGARRVATFGGTAYNGALGEEYVIRSNAWLLNQQQNVAIFSPPSSDVEQYFDYLVKNSYDAHAALYPFVGSVCVGVGGVSCGNKAADMTANGHWMGAENFGAGVGIPGTWFMDGYMAFVMEKAKMFFAGSIPSIDTVAADHVGNYMVANAAVNCAYNTTPYVFPFSGLDATISPYPGPNNTSVASPQSPAMYIISGNLLNSISGDPIFSAAYSSQDVGGIGGTEKNATASAAASGTSLSITGATDGTIVAGAQIYDLTTPSAIPAHTYVVTGGASSLTLSTATTVANGDSLGFSHFLNYPDTYTDAAIPAGSLFTPINLSLGLEEAPNPFTVGAAPPGGFSYGSWYVWTPSDASGTSGRLSPFGGGAAITPTTTGSMTWGFIPNTTCPPPSAGEINDGSADFQANGSRMAEQYAVANIWAALVGNTGQAAAAVTNIAPFQTPISIYNAIGGPKWLYDSTFSYNP